MTTVKHHFNNDYPNGKSETAKMFAYAAKIREEEAAKARRTAAKVTIAEDGTKICTCKRYKANVVLFGSYDCEHISG